MWKTGLISQDFRREIEYTLFPVLTKITLCIIALVQFVVTLELNIPGDVD